MKYGDLRFDMNNIHENQVSNYLKSSFQIATKYLKINSIKTRHIL
jgi:hypothetical protein